jgi:hypothetical protein
MWWRWKWIKRTRGREGLIGAVLYGNAYDVLCAAFDPRAARGPSQRPACLLQIFTPPIAFYLTFRRAVVYLPLNTALGSSLPIGGPRIAGSRISRTVRLTAPNLGSTQASTRGKASNARWTAIVPFSGFGRHCL